MPKINPLEVIRQMLRKSDVRVRSTDGHPILPTWMKESPKENVLPYNHVTTYLKNGRNQDGHRVSRSDFDMSYQDDD